MSRLEKRAAAAATRMWVRLGAVLGSSRVPDVSQRFIVLAALAACSTGSSTPSNLDAALDTAPADAGFHDVTTDVAPAEGGSNCYVRPDCEACHAQGNICCVSPNPSPPPGYDVTCAACATGFGAVFVSLGCNGGADCPDAGVCCIEKDTNSNVQSICAPSCDSTQRQAQLCDPSADTKCPPTAVCTSSSSNAWNLPRCYGTCGGALPPP
jgi:hypothetical protein